MGHAVASAHTSPLSVLIVEDSAEDSDLIVEELKRGGFEPDFQRVENPEQMKQALDERAWDVVLSGFQMPRFALGEALHLMEQKGADVPFVIVSGTIGEEAAVEAMRAGAHDYVLKHRLERLVPVVRRELRESAIRRERRNLEERLRHAQKLESLGVLAGGVAHDFNNLLTGILGNTSLVLEILKPEPPTRGMLEEVIRASERAADLTRQLLAYAGKGRFVTEPLEVSGLVRAISHLIRASVPRTIDLSLRLDAGLPNIEADPSQIQQLVMNLILNAVEATGERPGNVRVTTGIQEVWPGDPLGRYRPDPPAPGFYVSLQVSDDGCGMSESVQAQIFDPFFTTKFMGRGLGLAAALGIVTGHKGVIGVESVEGEGSTFTVLLPVADRTAARRADVSHAVRGPAQTAGVILVIDDEDLVRHAARAALEHHGFTVFEAADGHDGADLFSRLHDRISVVLLDLTMPRMDGRSVWQYIRRVRPDMRVVISSGYEESEARERFGCDPELVFIQKPYVATALLEKIWNAMPR